MRYRACQCEAYMSKAGVKFYSFFFTMYLYRFFLQKMKSEFFIYFVHLMVLMTFCLTTTTKKNNRFLYDILTHKLYHAFSFLIALSTPSPFYDLIPPLSNNPFLLSFSVCVHIYVCMCVCSHVCEYVCI